MENERRILQLECQNKLLKLGIGLIAAVVFSMGAASFNQDRGELLNITKIQLVDSNGNPTGTIDAKGINLTSADSQVVANTIIGRRRVEANSNPENSQRYAEFGVTTDKTCYMELANKGAVYHHILNDSGTLESNF
jgi:hypothetical protein